MDFIEAERSYTELKQRYDAGNLSAADFDAALRELMVQDDRGRWWAKSRDTGDWNYYDNAAAAWVVAKPPVTLPAAPDLPPAQIPSAPAPQTERQEQRPASGSPEPAADFMPPVELGAGAASARPGLDAFVPPAQGEPLLVPAEEPEIFMPPADLGPLAPSAATSGGDELGPAPGAPVLQEAAESQSFMPPADLGPLAPSVAASGADEPGPAQGEPRIQQEVLPAATPSAARPSRAGWRSGRLALILAIVLIAFLCLCVFLFVLVRTAGGN